ncbi:MAG: efflux RND transporter periplasmic adaptor subunit [Deltaproteobacteria bacterium]|nr:efflux RND transporter periplasmic adaptor subunit [Deltaproteobacteria bacterium]
MKKRLKRPIVLLAIVILAVVYFTTMRDNEETGKITVSGNIEITDVQLSFKIPGRLEGRLVDEGQVVTAGQLVAHLDSADQSLNVNQAQAQVAYAEAVLADLEIGSRQQEIDSAEAELKRALAGAKAAEEQMKLASREAERFKGLYEQGVVSQREYDVHHTNYQTAKSGFGEARELVKRAREQLSLIREGARQGQIKQAQAQLELSRQALLQAKQMLKYTSLLTPAAGVVLSTSAEPGEYLNPGSPVLAIGDLHRVWMRAYVNESDLGKFKLGQEVQVKTDAYPDEVFSGSISFISSEAEFTPKAVQTREERVKLMYRIKIKLENPALKLKPGMPADAVIAIGD